MGFKCGIVGLPNVGKSTLFNALTATAAAEAANYPFCTIEPNSGRIGVPDERLLTLAEIAKSQTLIPTPLEILDIAGLVRGASKGEGLGNQFLGHIRSVDAILHVLRCFEDENITHVEGSIDPLRDATTIETELLLCDLDSVERRLVSLEKKVKTGDVLAKKQIPWLMQIRALLNEGKPARMLEVSAEDQADVMALQLLTQKPILYICNVSESEATTGNTFTESVKAYGKASNIPVVIISVAIESEIAQLSNDAEKNDFLMSLGLKETGLKQVAREGFRLLDLLTFFTVGPKEARAWTVSVGAKAPQAAGVIHTDFERGFICAETIAYEDYVFLKGEQGAKASGKMRQEGRDYRVQEGDVFHFRFNV